MRRYYAFVLCKDGYARLLKALDGERVLAETAFNWETETSYVLRLDVNGSYLKASINGQNLFDLEDLSDPLTCGGIALLVDERRLAANDVTIMPL